MLFQFWMFANVAFDPAQRWVDITKLRRKFVAQRTHLQTAVPSIQGPIAKALTVVEEGVNIQILKCSVRVIFF